MEPKLQVQATIFTPQTSQENVVFSIMTETTQLAETKRSSYCSPWTVKTWSHDIITPHMTAQKSRELSQSRSYSQHIIYFENAACCRNFEYYYHYVHLSQRSINTKRRASIIGFYFSIDRVNSNKRHFYQILLVIMPVLVVDTE